MREKGEGQYVTVSVTSWGNVKILPLISAAAGQGTAPLLPDSLTVGVTLLR